MGGSADRETVDDLERSRVDHGDIAAAAHFLATDAAGYINGEILDVDGGVYFD